MLSLIIKKELEDLEKLKLKLLTFILIFLSGFSLYSQDLDYSKGEIYILDEITVTGLKSFNEQTVITYTGLTQGKRIRIPGEEISQVINKLWKLELDVSSIFFDKLMSFVSFCEYDEHKKNMNLHF